MRASKTRAPAYDDNDCARRTPQLIHYALDTDANTTSKTRIHITSSRVAATTRNTQLRHARSRGATARLLACSHSGSQTETRGAQLRQSLFVKRIGAAMDHRQRLHRIKCASAFKCASAVPRRRSSESIAAVCCFARSSTDVSSSMIHVHIATITSRRQTSDPSAHELREPSSDSLSLKRAAVNSRRAGARTDRRAIASEEPHAHVVRRLQVDSSPHKVLGFLHALQVALR